MSIRRIVGIGLALLSAAVLVFDVAKGLSGAGLLGFVSLGDLWARVNGASLNLVQAIVQRYLLPALWDPMLVTVLLVPAWPLLGGAAALFLWPRSKSRNELFPGEATVTNSTTHPNS